MSDDEDLDERQADEQAPVLTKDGRPHPQPHLQRWEFPPGQSGNPSGRKPGALSFEQIIAKILDEEIADTGTTRRELVARIYIDEIVDKRNTVLIKSLLDRIFPTPQGDAAASLAGSVKSWVEIVRERTEELEAEAAEVVDLRGI